MFPCKEALVTGAGRGLGRAFAEALLAEGVTVWGTSRSGNALPAGVRPLRLDLASPASVAALAEQLRREAPALDLLVNNAGAGVFCPFAHFPEESLDAQWQVLLAGPVSLCRAFYPAFAERGRGTIVNVASLAGVFPIPFMSAYSAAKAALSTFSKTLMLEADGSGVAVVDFQPGDYATGFNDAMAEPPVPDDARLRRARAAAERHFVNGPLPQHAARRLMRAIRSERSGTVVSGNFFEATLGPLAARLLPQAVVRRILRIFYNL
ncbi:MAG: SDR family NAD(P)-dependent oxidoreductase [Puniceicoccales bacterium]|jgi:NAD(P)-dependent dehydrogenase (short-subunit alcohol dehydrogenase family)|nr:SDR family NAD(P)-dependent oxidoreductase [Puniceicoccales bacterium]